MKTRAKAGPLHPSGGSPASGARGAAVEERGLRVSAARDAPSGERLVRSAPRRRCRRRAERQAIEWAAADSDHFLVCSGKRGRDPERVALMRVLFNSTTRELPN